MRRGWGLGALAAATIVAALFCSSLAAQGQSLKPTITGLSPIDGVAGTVVTISGTNLADATKVRFGTVNQPSFTPSATEIDTTVPDHFSSGKVTVVTPAGTVTSKQTFAVSKVTSLTPRAATAGKTLTIAGQGLGSTTTVDFPGHAGVAPIVSPSTHAVKVVVPPDATAGALTVHTANLASLSTAAFKPLPAITGFATNPNQAGDTVTVDGTNLLADGPVSGKLGTRAITVTALDATSFQFDVPDSAVTAPVSLTTGAGTAKSKAMLLVRPRVDSGPDPDHGIPGQQVTLTGLTFTGVKAVTFGGAPAKFTAAKDGTSLEATVPAAATTGEIAVRNAGGSTDAGAFTVQPWIASFAPTSAAAGATLTVKGGGLSGATLVDFSGGVSAAPTSTSATSLKVAVPDGAASGTITVHTPAGTWTSSSPLNVTGTILSVSPTHGLAGTTVTIRGTGFAGVKSVTFNSVPATFHVDTPTQITAVAPAGGDGEVKVLRAAAPKALTAVASFALLAVTSISATTGHAGDDIELVGSELDTASLVTFGSGATASPSSTTPTSIHVHVPNQAGSGSVTITTALGDVTAPSFSAILPVVTGVAIENRGFNAAYITITGTGFVGVAHVTVGSVPLAFVDQLSGTSTELKFQMSVTPQENGVVTVTTLDGDGTSDASVVVHVGDPTLSFYYADTSPLGTYTLAAALEAASTRAGGVTLPVDQDFTCDGEAAVALSSSPMSFVWVYGAGPLQGAFASVVSTTPACPTDTSQTWN